MAKSATEMKLRLAQERGAKIERPAMDVKIPELVALMEKFHQMKQEHSKKHADAFEKKLAKLDELIAAIGNIKLEVKPGESGSKQVAEISKILLQIKKEHSTVTAEHKAMKEVAHVHENCNYKVTGRRDQRGLIDLEHGLLFEVVK